MCFSRIKRLGYDTTLLKIEEHTLRERIRMEDQKKKKKLVEDFGSFIQLDQNDSLT
jgi:hypothetical protein